MSLLLLLRSAAPAAKAATLTDDFTTQDAGKWTGWATGVAVVGGRLRITTTGSYASLTSTARYDLTGSSTAVTFATYPNVGAGSTEQYMKLLVDASNSLEFGWTNGTYFMNIRTGGVSNNTFAAPAGRNRVRIRESAGTVYWEASADGVTWDALRSASSGTLNLTSLQVQFQTGFYGTETAPGYAEWDDLNTAPPVTDPRPTGVYFNYRADDAAATYATATTTGGIVDSSGNNRPNAIPSTSAARPTLNTGGAGGHSYLTFDGTDDRLTTSNGTDPSLLAFGNAKPGLTVAAVAQVNTAALGGTSRYFAFFSIAGSGSTRLALYVDATGNWAMSSRRLDADATLNLVSTTPADNNRHLIAAVADYTNGQQRLYLDGTLIAQQAMPSSGSSSATNGLAWSLGSNNTPANWIPAPEYYELIGYDRALTSTEVGQLWSYGQTRYGLTSAAGFTGTAALSGDGSLTAAGTARLAGAATLSGDGALTAAGKPAVVGAAALSGTGTLAGTGKPAAAGVAALTGSGTLTATGTPATSRAATFTGAGTLTAPTKAAAGAVVSLAGDGTLTPTTAPATTATAPLAGDGTLTTTEATAGTSSATLAGDGALTAAGATTIAAVNLISEAEFRSVGSNPAVCTPVTAAVGDYLVAVAHFRTGAVANTTTATDSAGNTWTRQATNVLSGVNSRIVILTAPVTTALNAGTVTIQTSASYAWTVNITRWSGVAAVGASASTNQAATTTPAAVTVDTTTPGDAVVGGISVGNATAPTLNAGSGFTALTGASPNTGYYGANAYRLPGAVGTYGPSWTTPSAGSASAVVALTAATGGPVTPPAPAGILANGSFEVDTNGDGLADNWDDEHFVPTKPTYTLVGSPVTAGTKAQRIQYAGEPTLNGTHKTEIYQATPVGSVAEGQAVTFSVWVSGTLTNCYAFIGVEAFTSTGAYINEYDFTITPTGTPQQFTVTHPSLPAGSSYLAVYLQVAELYPTSAIDLVLDAATVDVTVGASFTGGGDLSAAGSASAAALGVAAFGGSGSLTIAATPAVPVVAALSGGGALTTSTTPRATSAAVLAGSGTLTAVSAPAFPGTVAFAGSGSLTATTKPAGTGGASLSGTGTLTATGKLAGTATTTLSGTGALTVAGTPRITGAAALTGTGTLTAAGVATTAGAGTANLTGTGTVTVTGVPRVTATAILNGTGTLTTSATPRITQTAALTGAGTLTVTTKPTTAGPAALTGNGALTATGNATTANSGTAALTGTGALTAAPKPAPIGTAAFTGAGQLTTTATPKPTGVATLHGDGTLTTTTSPRATGAAGFTGSGDLTASGSGGFPGVAYLTGAGTLTALTIYRDVHVHVSGPYGNRLRVDGPDGHALHVDGPDARARRVTGPTPRPFIALGPTGSPLTVAGPSITLEAASASRP